MHQVTIVGFDQAYASAITGALDLFALAGVSAQRMASQPVTPLFSVQIAAWQKQPVRCINQLTLQSQVAIQDVSHTDVLLIPTIGGDPDRVLSDNRRLLPFIRQHYEQGADIASNCSGAFFLAEAGLLNGKQATTHWGYAQRFKQRYPEVNLQPDKLITVQDRIYCAGGGMAWFDLVLLLIERFCGHDIARSTARAHVIDMVRGEQAAYGEVRSKKYHQDKDILAVQDWLEREYAQPVNLQTVAQRFNFTPRTFVRRFKQATGETPLHYLQRVRVDAAKQWLEQTAGPIEQVVNQVGYDDIASFSRLFSRYTGLTPGQYRSKFKRTINE
ncbi:helix-turn-helix domain-containing protein [Aestuariibacter halophilus]|uniref:Helix-turn-helix domain-containing protein n=1 Tax=Fluctibacter halophilus TaxID=226011 RepID=A0ABS8G4H5_9ALTE|nr:helix-turn-helix domain-containing protein [Aestuariibacter halophilus]MCC2615383.1 helix-turn-helix domain-containing protein [Aestuariibacter halophilus]